MYVIDIINSCLIDNEYYVQLIDPKSSRCKISLDHDEFNCKLKIIKESQDSSDKFYLLYICNDKIEQLICTNDEETMIDWIKNNIIISQKINYIVNL